MASHTKQIPPGGEGKITLKVDTEGFGGKSLTKGALVETNDKAHPKFNLKIQGQVEAFAAIDPRRVNLSGAADQDIQSKVTITPINEKHPFKISDTKAEKNQDIRFKLEEVKDSGKVKYILTVENMKKTPGRYVDNIILKTDSSLRPEIQIGVYGNIFEAPKKKP